MTTFVRCSDGRQVQVLGSGIPSQRVTDEACAAGKTTIGGTMSGNLRLPQGLIPTSGPGDPGSGVSAGGFTDFLKGAGLAIAGAVKDVIPGEIDDRLINRFIGSSKPDLLPQQPQLAKGCPPGFEKKGGRCVETGVRGTVRRVLPGGKSGTLEDSFGEATMGRFGVALVPGERVTSVLDCPEGMVLGKDNLCYERLRKSERKWPPGRKPLLTGGEMNAITTASRVAKKLNRTKKKLRGVKNALKKVT